MGLGLDISCFDLEGLEPMSLLWYLLLGLFCGLTDPFIWLCVCPRVPLGLPVDLLGLLGGGTGNFRPPVSLSVAVNVFCGIWGMVLES